MALSEWLRIESGVCINTSDRRGASGGAYFAFVVRWVKACWYSVSWRDEPTNEYLLPKLVQRFLCFQQRLQAYPIGPVQFFSFALAQRVQSYDELVSKQFIM